MKKIILIISLLIICGSMGIAAAQNNDEHLNRMVECINNGDFDCAITEIPQIENWTFVMSPDSSWLDFSQTKAFVSSSQVAKLSAKQKDSFAFYFYSGWGKYLNVYYGQGKYDKAVEGQDLSVFVQETLVGKNHKYYADATMNCAILYTGIGDYLKGEEKYLEALDVYKQVDGERSLHYLRCLSNLGDFYHTIGNYSKAIEFSVNALNLKKEVLGPLHPSYATSLQNVANLYEDKGDLSTAEQYYLEALQIYTETSEENSTDCASILHNLGNVYSKMDKHDKAEQCYQDALRIHQSLPNHINADYGLLLNAMGLFYFDGGDYGKAEQFYLEAVEVFKQVLGESHPYFAASIMNLGNFYDATHDFASAEMCYLYALDVIKNTWGEKNYHYAQVLKNIGDFYDRRHDSQKAEKYLFAALDIAISIYGENSPSTVTFYNSIAGFYYYTRDFVQSEHYYMKALTICREVYGENHSTVAYIYTCLANLYYLTGDDQKTKEYYLKALDLQKQVVGVTHQTYSETLGGYGLFCLRSRNYAEAERVYREAQQIDRAKFIQSLGFMTEGQRANYWTTMHENYLSIYPGFCYLYHKQNPSITTFSYDNELFVKGVLLQSSNAIRYSILESGNSELIQQWKELNALIDQISSLQQEDSVTEVLVTQMSQAERLEKEITRKSAAYRENMRQWTITWDSVRAVLKPRHVAIEYMSAPLNDDTTMYCALLLRDTCSYPILIPLFEEKEIKGLKDADLSKKIWHNVMPYMNAGETVFFSPTGVLHQIAIENLPYDETRTMGDVYEMVRLSSTRELAMHRTPVKHSSATLYGGIYYQEMDSVTMRQISEQYRTRDMSYEPALANDTTQRALPKYLPGTQKEIDSIQPILTKRHIAVKLHSKRDACEESVKALSGKKQNIIHLATHGFFWQNTTQSTDPMERCGLLFAGANTALSGHNERLAAGVDDGILTAKEISLLDLRDADVVVLSACETALGDITGEGVFGLQRAFKMAGARTILMALWKVNDDATRMLMTAFYRNYSKGQTKRAAFRNAQQEVRTYTRTETRPVENASSAGKDKMRKGQSSPITTETTTTQPYKDPYYWAGFILLD